MSVATRRFPTQPTSEYDEVRREIISGDLLLCSGTSVFSSMIQAATKSIWSHVGFVMRLDSIDRVMVLESVESIGVRTVPLSKYLYDYDSRGNPYPGRVAIARHSNFSKMANAKRLYQFGQFAVDLFGYPYDKDEIIKIGARIGISHLPFTKKIQKSLKRDREYICSEYVWESYRRLGIQIPCGNRGFISPADFARAKEVQLLSLLK